MGRICVFFVLNLAPDAKHHPSRTLFSSSRSSSSSRNTVVSSAKSIALRLSPVCGIFSYEFVSYTVHMSFMYMAFMWTLYKLYMWLICALYALYIKEMYTLCEHRFQRMMTHSHDRSSFRVLASVRAAVMFTSLRVNNMVRLSINDTIHSRKKTLKVICLLP